jgi:hypothetical protein
MHGNVFELPNEGHAKSTQFTKTMAALDHYASLELDYVTDLASLFAMPPTEPIIDEPPMEPPLVDDPTGTGSQIRATHEFFEYHQWKSECKNYLVRKRALEENYFRLLYSHSSTMQFQCGIQITKQSRIHGSKSRLQLLLAHHDIERHLSKF